MPQEETQQPKEREWPDDFSNLELGLALVGCGAAAVLVPVYGPRLYSDTKLPDFVLLLVSIGVSITALGLGAWIGIILWQRRFPRTHWRKVRRRLTTATWAALTAGGVLLEAWPWVVLFAVLLALQLTRRSQLVVWENLGHATKLLAYQGGLTVNLNIRTALALPAVRTYFLEGHPGCDDEHFDAWIDARCSELASGPHEQVHWTFDNFCVYKNGERQFVRAVYHEITPGPESRNLSNSWDDVTLRLCILSGWLKLQVGRGKVKRWRDITAFPLYMWVYTHRLPALYMNFNANLENDRISSGLDDWRAVSRQINQRASDYLRYIEESGGWHERSTSSWFRDYINESWNKDDDEWRRTSGAEVRRPRDGMHIFFQNVMDVSIPLGGADQRDMEFEKVLQTYRDPTY